MEETAKRKLFPGAGILVGFVLGLIVMAIIIAFTGRVKSAIPIGIATGSSIGTVIEQYLQDNRKGTDPVKKKAALLIIALGGIMLFILYFISNTD